MSAPYPPIGRRHLLASTLVGTIGVLIPVSPAHGATLPPAMAGAEAAAPAAPASAASAAAAIVEASLIEAPAAAEPAGDTSIRPFRFHASDEALADLKRRIKATKWPEREIDPTQGVGLATMQKLADYWANQSRLAHAPRRRSIPIRNFVTTIDGVDIHFIHVRSKHPNALPMIITHGWPGSVIEQLKIIGPLTDPTAHGGTAADAFDVVIPSLPGYGFSGKPTVHGWDPQHIARAWAVLMERLGYTRYVAQGGDWGNAVTEQMALQQPPGLLAIHTNMPATVPAEIARAASGRARSPWPQRRREARLGPARSISTRTGSATRRKWRGRPQTLYALADSPVGLAAWIIDHDIRSYDLIARVFDGANEGLTRDDILDNITLYWLTNTAVSSARLYRESKLAFFAPKGVPLPTGVSAFRDEIYQAPESWTRKAYPHLVFYKAHAKGTHFAAWEQPQALDRGSARNLPVGARERRRRG